MSTVAFNKDAYQIAWNWFRVHADQRMELFKTYTFLVVGLSAGYISLYNLKSFYAAVGVAVLGFFITFAFKFLDMRVSSLLKIAESALKVEEERLSFELLYEEIKVEARSSDRSSGYWTYRRIFNVIYFGAALLFASGVVAALFGV